MEFLNNNFFGIRFNDKLNWESHIDKILNRCLMMIDILTRLKRLIPLNIKIIVHNTLIMQRLNYGVMTWDYQCNRIQKHQKKLVGVISVRQ